MKKGKSEFLRLGINHFQGFLMSHLRNTCLKIRVLMHFLIEKREHLKPKV